jgi:aryl-alcohol dehydrogenase-like predicted oxidoreductase
MEFVRLGRSGLKVSKICLGTMTFGREADEQTSFRIMDRYMELGGNFMDTADQYSFGISEEVVGRWIAARGVRNQVILATKVYQQMSPLPNDGFLSRYHTDVIDLYQIHRWDPETPPEETLEALNDLVRQGKVRYIGCSNLKAWHLAQYLSLSERNHWSRMVCMQPIFSALNRSIESEILPYCAEEGLGVIVYNPLAGGMLTGKYRRGQPLPQGARLQSSTQYYDRYYTEQALDIVETFVRAAEERGVTPAQLALAWVLGEPRVTCPIVGARNLEQLNDTLGGLAIELTPEERATVPAVLPGRWVGLDQVYDRDYTVR